MKSKEMAAYVHLVEQMSEKAICFLGERGIIFPASYRQSCGCLWKGVLSFMVIIINVT